MADLIDYNNPETTDFYLKKGEFASEDYFLGSEDRVWITPLLDPNSNRPVRHRLLFPTEGIPEDATSATFIVVDTDLLPITLYKGDFILDSVIDSAILLVISEDIYIDSAEATIKFLPAPAGFEEKSNRDISFTFAMTPLHMETTSTLEIENQLAKGESKDHGYTSAVIKIGADGTIDIEGNLIRNDPAMKLLSNAIRNTSRFYLETRLSPFIESIEPDGTTAIIQAGKGAANIVGSFVLESFFKGSARGNVVTVNVTFRASGRIEEYQGAIFSPKTETDYCPFFTSILPDFEWDATIFRIVGYCPLDTDSLPNFTADPNA